MIAYLDESYDKDKTVFSLAGFVSQVHCWERLKTEWKNHLEWAEVDVFHMNRFESRVKEYDGWSNAKRIEFLQRLVRTIHRDVAIGIGHTMVMRDYDRVASPIIKGLRLAAHDPRLTQGKNPRKPVGKFEQIADIYSPPYVYLLKAWMEHLCVRLSNSWPGEKIACVFDRNFEVEGRVRFHYELLLNNRPDLAALFHNSITFADKTDPRFMALQTPDMLAYELQKDMLNKVTGEPRSQRKLLVELASCRRIWSAYHDDQTITQDLAEAAKLVEAVGNLASDPR
jgi:hypothetical protein